MYIYTHYSPLWYRPGVVLVNILCIQCSYVVVDGVSVRAAVRSLLCYDLWSSGMCQEDTSLSQH